MMFDVAVKVTVELVVAAALMGVAWRIPEAVTPVGPYRPNRVLTVASAVLENPSLNSTMYVLFASAWNSRSASAERVIVDVRVSSAV